MIKRIAVWLLAWVFFMIPLYAVRAPLWLLIVYTVVIMSTGKLAEYISVVTYAVALVITFVSPNKDVIVYIFWAFALFRVVSWLIITVTHRRNILS